MSTPDLGDGLRGRCEAAEAYAKHLVDELAEAQARRRTLDAASVLLARLDQVGAARDDLADVVRRIHDQAPHLVAAVYAARETPSGGQP